MHKYVLILILLFWGCTRPSEDLQPKINYSVQDKYLNQLPSPFPPLSSSEKAQAWGQEYQIGLAFAHKLDLYQAITAFKRAEILAPEELKERKLELNYEMMICYYLGKKYHDVISTFEDTQLHYIDNHFPAFQDLLVMLYDSYSQVGDTEKADQALALIKEYYPETADKLVLSSALSRADIPQIKAESSQYPYLNDLVTAYEKERKSIGGAKALNAVLPGAGYLYLGQKQTAVTAFLVNGLFIAAAYYSFHHGNTAAGVLFTGFEAGWYFGGIYGATEEAKFYNERVYEKHATPLMNQKGLFPVFMLNHAF